MKKETVDEPQATSTSSKSTEDFQKTELLNIRTRLAGLDYTNVRKYFAGFREVKRDLQAKQEELEAEAILYDETLAELRLEAANCRDALGAAKAVIESEVEEFNESQAGTRKMVLEEAPEVADELARISRLEKELACLRLARNVTERSAIVRLSLGAADFARFLDNYSALLRLPDGFEEFPAEFREKYATRMTALEQEFFRELKAALSAHLLQMHFPFDKSIDYSSMKAPLQQAVTILRCIHSVSANLEDARTDHLELELLFTEFSKRFHFHFYGERPTNSPAKPEWFFTQLSLWAANHVEFFDLYVQPMIDELYDEDVSAPRVFLEHLMSLATRKVRSLIEEESFVADRRLLSHLIDETVIFEREFIDVYSYPEDAPHAISELCLKEVLEAWIKLERDTLSVAVDSILADPHAFENRYKDVPDVDMHLVPTFADSFVVLMQSMFERYRSVPDERIQCQFMKLQLVIVDEFRIRIDQLFKETDSPWRAPYPQLMNALKYVTLVLEEWNDWPEFIRLQYFLESSTGGAVESSLTKRVFDESAGLYDHVWKLRAREMSQSFAATIRDRMAPYARQKWDAIDVQKPVDVSPTFTTFLTEVSRLLGFVNAEISPDSIMTLYILLNDQVWKAVEESVVNDNPFTGRGAAQVLFDVTSGLIPLLNTLFKRPKALGEFSAIRNMTCVAVLNSLRLLSLPAATAILLRSEVERIPEEMLEEKLKPFDVADVSKERVLELFKQRRDMSFSATSFR